MNCHNSYTDYIEQSINRYRDPIPLGIGCERCHGPGKLHVDKHFNAEFSGLLEGRIDSTIVNPKHLPTDLQLDVCMQCHLQGRFLIFNEGRKHTDLKPGMKVREVKTIYIDTDFKPGDLHTTDQGTQMMRSKCFTGSRGLMTCTTCHDPHASAPAKSASNEKCLLCHKVSVLSRTNKKADHKKNSDCIHCHMPEKTEVVHVTFTDHWIRIVEEKTDSDINKNLSPAQHNIVSLKSIYDENDSIDSLRLGIAYAKFYNEEHIDSEYLLRAVPLLEEGLKNFPNHQKGRYYLGLTYILLKQFGKAQDHLELLVDKYPGNALGHRKLGWSYMKLGNVELAIDSYKKSISAYPMDVEVYYNLGNLYVSLNKNDKAIELYQKALEIRPDYAPAYNNLGNLFIAKLKKPEIAKNYYAKAVNNEPNLFTAMYNYAKVHLALGEEDEAIKLLGRTIKIYPRFSPAYIDLARLFKNRGQDQDAARILTKLLKLDPNNVDARTMLFQFNM